MSLGTLVQSFSKSPLSYIQPPLGVEHVVKLYPGSVDDLAHHIANIVPLPRTRLEANPDSCAIPVLKKRIQSLMDARECPLTDEDLTHLERQRNETGLVE